ncbi:hypothetical protein BDR07DRAFT_1444243, partial [Suillus spraguei]
RRIMVILVCSLKETWEMLRCSRHPHTVRSGRRRRLRTRDSTSSRACYEVWWLCHCKRWKAQHGMGGELVPNLLAHPPVNVDKQPVQNGASLGHTMPNRNLGLRAEVLHGMESARTSVATLDTAKNTCSAIRYIYGHPL